MFWYLNALVSRSECDLHLSSCCSKQSQCVGRGGDQAWVIQGHRRQQEAVPARFLGVCAESLQVPELANGQAELVKKPWVQDWDVVLAELHIALLCLFRRLTQVRDPARGSIGLESRNGLKTMRIAGHSRETVIPHPTGCVHGPVHT